MKILCKCYRGECYSHSRCSLRCHLLHSYCLHWPRSMRNWDLSRTRLRSEFARCYWKLAWTRRCPPRLQRLSLRKRPHPRRLIPEFPLGRVPDELIGRAVKTLDLPCPRKSSAQTRRKCAASRRPLEEARELNHPVRILRLADVVPARYRRRACALGCVRSSSSFSCLLDIFFIRSVVAMDW
jgi:hypothetical protein